MTEVLVDGIRCHVVRQDGERMLVQPVADAGRALNVKRWVAADETVPVMAAPTLSFSPEEIRQLAAVLRDVFYEGETPPGAKR